MSDTTDQVQMATSSEAPPATTAEVPTATLIDFDAEPPPLSVLHSTTATSSNLPTTTTVIAADSSGDSSSSAILIPSKVTPPSSPPSAGDMTTATCSSSSSGDTLTSTKEAEADMDTITRAFDSNLLLLDREVAKLEEVEEDAVKGSDKNQPPTVPGRIEDHSEPQIEVEEISTQIPDSSSPRLLTTTISLAEEEPEEEDDLEEEDGTTPISSSSEEGKSTVVEGATTTPALPPQTTTTTSSGSSPASQSSLVDLNQEYHLKWIKWKGNAKCPIVTQNSNGPCPLIAIINVLLLRKNIEFPPMIEIITAAQLMEYLCDFLLNNVPTNLPENVKPDFEQNLQDSLTILPRLSTGLDVNVRFSGIADFEYTSECIIFDLLRIPLYHGWLVNPGEAEVARIVDSLSYNQLVDRIITNKGSTDSNVNSEMFLAEEFLNTSASQLTHYGLNQLIERVNEDELCILFRNNHFITLYKCKGKLFQLVTDQGFLTESNVVWESLNNIEGDTHFVDGEFVVVPPKPASALSPTSFSSSGVVNTQQQIDQDYLIALSLEQEQKLELERATPTGQTVLPSPSSGTQPTTTTIVPTNPPVTIIEQQPQPQYGPRVLETDEEIARRLQAEEQAAFERDQREQQRQHRQAEDRQARHQLPVQHRNRYGSGNEGVGSRASGAMVNHYDARSGTTGQHHQVVSRHSSGQSGGGGSGSHQTTSRPAGHRGSAGCPEGSQRPSRPVPDEDGESSRSKSKNCSIQ